MNYQVPIGIQLNEAHKYAVVENNITSQTCKQKGGWGGALTIPGCEGRLFLFSFLFFKEPGVKMDSDSIYDQHKMTALMFDRKTKVQELKQQVTFPSQRHRCSSDATISF